MGRTLADIYGWMDNLAHGKRISNHELICPSSAIGIGLNDNVDRKQLATLWAVDPVHLAPAGYAKLAEKMVEAAAELRKQHPPTDRKKNEIQMPPPTPYPLPPPSSQETGGHQQKRPSCHQVGRQPRQVRGGSQQEISAGWSARNRPRPPCPQKAELIRREL